MSDEIVKWFSVTSVFCMLHISFSKIFPATIIGGWISSETFYVWAPLFWQLLLLIFQLKMQRSPPLQGFLSLSLRLSSLPPISRPLSRFCPWRCFSTGFCCDSCLVSHTLLLHETISLSLSMSSSSLSLHLCACYWKCWELSCRSAAVCLTDCPRVTEVQFFIYAEQPKWPPAPRLTHFMFFPQWPWILNFKNALISLDSKNSIWAVLRIVHFAVTLKSHLQSNFFKVTVHQNKI